jgi:GTP-binding protein LepA
VSRQTLANACTAVENSLEIIPVIRDRSPSAQPEEARRQIQEIIGLDGAGAVLASAKTGAGVPEILEATVDGRAAGRRPGRAARADSTGSTLPRRRHRRPRDDGPSGRDEGPADGAGVGPRSVAAWRLQPEGDGRRAGVGSLACREYQERRRREDRDTITETASDTRAVPGFKELKPRVFAGCIPSRAISTRAARGAGEIGRRASFFYEPETSVALGWLPLRVLDRSMESSRAAEREYNMDLVTTASGCLPGDDDRRRGARDHAREG